MALKPLGDRVIVKADEAETQTASGLYLASESKEKPQTGIVIAVGEGKLDKDGNKVPVPVKKGDKVIYGKYGGTEVTYDGEDVLILRADDIYAICE
jgi:chaperonin GroES